MSLTVMPIADSGWTRTSKEGKWVASSSEGQVARRQNVGFEIIFKISARNFTVGNKTNQFGRGSSKSGKRSCFINPK